MKPAEVSIQVESRSSIPRKSLSGEDTDPWIPSAFGDHRHGPRIRHRRLSLSSNRKINVL